MIFLDNASTTKLSEIAKAEMEKSKDLFYNPSASYNAGFDIKNKIIDAKKAICTALGTNYNDNLIITGSATEANNLAIFGSIKKTQEQLIFSIGEHPSVYNCAQELKTRGYNVKYVSLTKSGDIDIEDLKELLNKPTAFVSIIHVSNETGAINDIAKISKLIKQKQPNAIFYCDGVQAFGKISVNVVNLGVDFYTISAHKIHGPKGIGALYVKNIKKLKPIIFGGGQEFGIRSGTENTLYILTFGEIAKNLNIKEDFDKVSELNKYVRNFFENAVKTYEDCHSEQSEESSLLDQNKLGRDDSCIALGRDGNSSVSFRENEVSREISSSSSIILLNSSDNASPYILSYSFEGVRGETLVHILEDKGVIVGTGSACSSKKGALNRTLEAIGKNKSQNEGAIRISFSSDTTLDEVKFACQIILESYKELLTKLA